MVVVVVLAGRLSLPHKIPTANILGIGERSTGYATATVVGLAVVQFTVPRIQFKFIIFIRYLIRVQTPTECFSHVVFALALHAFGYGLGTNATRHSVRAYYKKLRRRIRERCTKSAFYRSSDQRIYRTDNNTS